MQSWVEESYRVGGYGPGSDSVTSSLYWAWVLIYKMWQISKTDPSCFGLTEYFCLVFSWTKLTERFFKNTPWPEAETIAPQVGNGRCPGCWMGSYDWKSLESSEWSVSILFFILFNEVLKRNKHKFTCNEDTWKWHLKCLTEKSGDSFKAALWGTKLKCKEMGKSHKRGILH